MTNYVKNYRKTATIKAYDLLELKANGRIDADGDYLDDDGNKMTYQLWVNEFREDRRSTDEDFAEQKDNLFYYGKFIGIFVETLENKQDAIHKDGFICVGAVGERWCVRRDIFLATYEEVKE